MNQNMFNESSYSLHLISFLYQEMFDIMHHIFFHHFQFYGFCRQDMAPKLFDLTAAGWQEWVVDNCHSMSSATRTTGSTYGVDAGFGGLTLDFAYTWNILKQMQSNMWSLWWVCGGTSASSKTSIYLDMLF